MPIGSYIVQVRCHPRDAIEQLQPILGPESVNQRVFLCSIQLDATKKHNLLCKPNTDILEILNRFFGIWDAEAETDTYVTSDPN